jgi:hypothetical protein
MSPDVPGVDVAVEVLVPEVTMTLHGRLQVLVALLLSTVCACQKYVPGPVPPVEI